MGFLAAAPDYQGIGQGGRVGNALGRFDIDPGEGIDRGGQRPGNSEWVEDMDLAQLPPSTQRFMLHLFRNGER